MTEGIEGRASGGGLRRAEQGSLFSHRRIIAVDRVNRVNRREALGQLVGTEDTDDEPPVTCPPPDDLPRA